MMDGWIFNDSIHRFHNATTADKTADERKDVKEEILKIWSDDIRKLRHKNCRLQLSNLFNLLSRFEYFTLTLFLLRLFLQVSVHSFLSQPSR